MVRKFRPTNRLGKFSYYKMILYPIIWVEFEPLCLSPLWFNKENWISLLWFILVYIYFYVPKLNISIWFHLDICQWSGYVWLNKLLQCLGIMTLTTFQGHKFIPYICWIQYKSTIQIKNNLKTKDKINIDPHYIRIFLWFVCKNDTEFNEWKSELLF